MEISNIFDDTYFMQSALQQAQIAFDENEVPIGAVVVYGNKIIGKGYNQTEKLTDVTAHAEMLAITAASNYIGSKYLTDCTLYITVEPCLMCAGAINWSRISKVVFGCYEPKFGYSMLNTSIIKPSIEIISGICETECALLMQDFFKSKRK